LIQARTWTLLNGALDGFRVALPLLYGFMLTRHSWKITGTNSTRTRWFILQEKFIVFQTTAEAK